MVPSSRRPALSGRAARLASCMHTSNRPSDPGYSFGAAAQSNSYSSGMSYTGGALKEAILRRPAESVKELFKDDLMEDHERRPGRTEIAGEHALGEIPQAHEKSFLGTMRKPAGTVGFGGAEADNQRFEINFTTSVVEDKHDHPQVHSEGDTSLDRATKQSHSPEVHMVPAHQHLHHTSIEAEGFVLRGTSASGALLHGPDSHMQTTPSHRMALEAGLPQSQDACISSTELQGRRRSHAGGRIHTGRIDFDTRFRSPPVSRGLLAPGQLHAHRQTQV
jgi:hypothetical protein